MPLSAIAIDEQVKQIIVDQLDVKAEDVVPGAHFQDDLGADSLDVVELIMQFEEKFNIVISDSNAANLTTVKDAMYYIQQNYTPSRYVESKQNA